jgi:hypothetical protein
MKNLISNKLYKIIYNQMYKIIIVLFIIIYELQICIYHNV